MKPNYVNPKTQEMRAKAIEIAKDVLLQLKLKAYIPQKMVYATNINFGSEKHLRNCSDYDLQEILLKNKQECKVCAIGSMFLSKVRKFNECRSLEEDFHWHLTMAFSPFEIAMIESAFEMNLFVQMAHKDPNKPKDYEEFLEAIAKQYFIQDYPFFTYEEKRELDKTRLRNICLNILRNNGEFKASRKTLRLYAKM